MGPGAPNIPRDAPNLDLGQGPTWTLEHLGRGPICRGMGLNHGPHKTLGPLGPWGPWDRGPQVTADPDRAVEPRASWDRGPLGRVGPLGPWAPWDLGPYETVGPMACLGFVCQWQMVQGGTQHS